MNKLKLSTLEPFELHKKLLDKYLKYCKFVDRKKYVYIWILLKIIFYQICFRKEKRDIDVIQENHKFVWDEDDEAYTWEQKLAKKYYDKLFKEYCICDLSLYKKSKVSYLL